MENTDLLYRYLISRGLSEPRRDFNQEILENDVLLADIAVIFQGHEPALKALLQARIQPIQREIIQEATPADVIVLRQAMLEVAMIYDDFQRYAAEWERREKERGTKPPVTIENAEPAGDPSSL